MDFRQSRREPPPEQKANCKGRIPKRGKDKMNRKLVAAAGGIALITGLLSPAMAETRSVNLQPGFTKGPDAAAPRAAPGSVTGYAVPMGLNGGQAGANWTSRSGNTNVGGYFGGNMNGGYSTGVGVGVHF
jgi:hypothetical protein